VRFLFASRLIYANRLLALDEISGWFVSISLRARGKNRAVKAKSLYNLTLQRKFDDFMKANYREIMIE
jgi:hypothetical protein